jgi:Carboxypeptidase regulatory-like domain
MTGIARCNHSHAEITPGPRTLSASLLVLLLSLPAPAATQVIGSTATVRGSVEDTSGGVLPGATVTLVNSSTRAIRTAITDERGAFTFSSVFPGTYDLRCELAGFKATEQEGISLSPNDTRGISIRLEISGQSEVVTVRAAQGEVIQTETGAREGVLTARQIDSLSIIGRSSLELLRILPGVVAPDQHQLESVSFFGGSNNTQAYTVNGIRSSGNTVSLDGSNLVEASCNCGVMTGVNNDMVQEVKIQSSNFGAEFGSGAVSISAVTRSGSSKVSGSLYDYVRDWRSAANDRSNSITGVEKPKSRFIYPGGNIGGPFPLPFSGYNAKRDKLFFWFGLEVQRQDVDSGSRLSTTFSEAARAGDLTEFLANRGQNLNHPAVVLIPASFPGEGTPAPDNNLAPYVTPLGRAMADLYPLPNHTDPDNRYNYVYSALEPTNRMELRTRFDWNVSARAKAYVRISSDREDTEGPRGPWSNSASDLALPTPGVGTNRAHSYAGTVVQVLSSTMTNEVLFTFTRQTLDASYRDPSKLRLDALNADFRGVFPSQSPYVPFNSHWGGSQLGNFGPNLNDIYAHNDELLFGDKLTKVRGAHVLKLGVSLDRLQRQQNGNNDENGNLLFAPWTPGGTGSQLGDLLVGRPAEIFQGTRARDARFRMWNMDAFAQDSWKLRSNLTLEYGMRVGYWTNNAELNGLGNWFDPGMYDPVAGAFTDPPNDTQMNGVRYAARGQAPLGVLPNRSPFALPRVNVAWDLHGNGVSVLRGGYGMFANRPRGSVEAGPALNVPPNGYHVGADAFYDTSLGGTGLTYDTFQLIPFQALLSSQIIQTPTPTSFTFPKTDSYSVSFARRIFSNQVVEAAYVGTRGRHLVSAIPINVVPFGALSSGVVGNADLSVPVNRVNLDASVVNARRPFPTYAQIYASDYEGRSRYWSLQVTLSRQTGKRIQYLAAYTLSKTQGTLRGEYLERDPFDPARTYGVLDEDRRHIFNLSWNAVLPDGSGHLNNAFGRAVLGGWQLSGISTFTSGAPIRLSFSGDATGNGVSQAYFRTSSARPAALPTASRRHSCATRGSEDPRSAKRSST